MKSLPLSPDELDRIASFLDSLGNGWASTKKAMSDRHAIMSDMSSNRITVRVPQTLTIRLRNRSRAQGTTESELIREALETYLGHAVKESSAYELAEEAGIIGSVQNAPKDLSTNRRHFNGFGKSK
jgi:predicted DNA-binding protein